MIDLGGVLDRDIETKINNQIAILQNNKYQTIIITEIETHRKFKIVLAILPSRVFLD